MYADFKLFNFLVQQHENSKPTESNTIVKYILFDFILMNFSLVWNKYGCNTNF